VTPPHQSEMSRPRGSHQRRLRRPFGQTVDSHHPAHSGRALSGGPGEWGYRPRHGNRAQAFCDRCRHAAHSDRASPIGILPSQHGSQRQSPGRRRRVKFRLRITAIRQAVPSPIGLDGQTPGHSRKPCSAGPPRERGRPPPPWTLPGTSRLSLARLPSGKPGGRTKAGRRCRGPACPGPRFAYADAASDGHQSPGPAAGTGPDAASAGRGQVRAAARAGDPVSDHDRNLSRSPDRSH
jgi:hypothetical protein